MVNLSPEITNQTFEGFGGAFNESAAQVCSLMPEKEKRALLEAYFGKAGMNHQFVRVHLDSCDFTLGQYEAMSDPDDKELKSFSMARSEKYIKKADRFRELHRALQVRPQGCCRRGDPHVA